MIYGVLYPGGVIRASVINVGLPMTKRDGRGSGGENGGGFNL